VDRLVAIIGQSLGEACGKAQEQQQHSRANFQQSGGLVRAAAGHKWTPL